MVYEHVSNAKLETARSIGQLASKLLIEREYIRAFLTDNPDSCDRPALEARMKWADETAKVLESLWELKPASH